MSSTEDKATAVNPNTEVIQGLREAADWLEAHPELPPCNGLISHYAYGQEAREALTTVAAALGERASEQAKDDRVCIEGRFSGRVRVLSSTAVEYLGGTLPVAPRYEAIIKPEYSVRIGLAGPR